MHLEGGQKWGSTVCFSTFPLQVSRASHLAGTSELSERQLQQEAAEALMGLKDSSQAPLLTPSVLPNPAWISPHHPCDSPGNLFPERREWDKDGWEVEVLEDAGTNQGGSSGSAAGWTS